MGVMEAPYVAFYPAVAPRINGPPRADLRLRTEFTERVGAVDGIHTPGRGLFLL